MFSCFNIIKHHNQNIMAVTPLLKNKMRTFKSVFIVVFLVLWVWVLFLLSGYPAMDSNTTYKPIYEKMQNLELNIKTELTTNRELILRLLFLMRGLKVHEDNLLLKGIATKQLVTDLAAVGITNQSDPVDTKYPSKYYGPVIPVLVFACNRVTISKCLNQLIEYRPNAQAFPIIVSLDCNDEKTLATVKSFENITIIRQPDQSDIMLPLKDQKFKGYYKIARHYGWALNETFQRGYNSVIVIEDDLNVAPDIFEYFLGTNDLLHSDPSIWCVSAWNDNGKTDNIDVTDATLLYRSDFFPGLGWMLTKNLWSELSVKWPIAFWDDWIRQPAQRKNRVCIRPEISRTSTFGKIGVSNGLFFEKHLRHIRLSEHYVEFSKMNLTGLKQKAYDESFITKVYLTPLVTLDELLRGMHDNNGSVRIQYNTRDQYKRITRLLGLMDDFKSGVPRTGYHGIVSLFYSNRRVYLAPNKSWTGYDLTWS